MALTPDDLVEIHLIERLKHRYLRGLDQKDWDLVESCFTPGATASYSGGAFELEGRDQIMGFLRDAMGAETFLSSHRCGQPEIDLLGGGRATGIWALEDHVILEDFDLGIHGAAFYTDTYVKDPADGEWRIESTAYKRTYEELVPRASIPGLKVTAIWWRTNGRSELTG